MSSEYLRNVSVRRFPHPVEKNPVLRILGSAISSVITVVLGLPLLLAFLVVLPACLSVRWLLLFIHCSRQGHRFGLGPESVRGNDSRWLGTEWRSSVIHAILIFEAKEGVNVDHFRRLLLKRVIPVYPRLTQRLISLPISAGVGNCWLTDSEFSIDKHVFSGPAFLTTDKDLQDYVSKLIEDGLPEDKPPWQLQVFQSFGENRDTVLVLRIHQSVADGTALMRLLCHSLADSQVIEIPERPRFGSLAFCMNIFRACFVGPLTLLVWLFLSGEDCNLLTHRSTWTGSVTVTWSASIMLSKVIRIKQVTRSTVNCVLLSALAGALRRLLEGRGVKQPSDVKVVVPMDLRNESSATSIKTKLGNKTSSVIVPLPVAMEGCIPRLWATRKTLDSLKTTADPVILYVATAALMSVGSATFARHLVKILTGKASLQFASLPGPTSEICMEGQTLKGIYPILPAQANLGISVTTITYADRVFVSVIAERALGPAAELILEYLEDQIEVLWKLLLNRRVPGEAETSAIFSKTRISESPVKEITSRLNSVQKEVERLSEGKENDKNGKLCTLRAEFSELVEELKRRQSLSDIEDLDSTGKSRQRTFSYSTSKKPLSSKPLRKDSNASETLQKKGTIDSSKKHPSQNTSTTRLKSTKSGSPARALESVCPKKKCDCPKDSVVNISEISRTSSVKNISTHQSAKKNPEDNENPRKSMEFSQKLKSEMISEKSKRTNNRPQKQIHKKEVESSDEESPEVGHNVKHTWSVEKLDKGESTLAGYKGPNELQCDINNLGVVKKNEKEFFQVPYHLYGLRINEKHEDSDESEIPGGVLI